MKTMIRYMRPQHWRLFALTSLFMFMQTSAMSMHTVIVMAVSAGSSPITLLQMFP